MTLRHTAGKCSNLCIDSNVLYCIALEHGCPFISWRLRGYIHHSMVEFGGQALMRCDLYDWVHRKFETVYAISPQCIIIARWANKFEFMSSYTFISFVTTIWWRAFTFKILDIYWNRCIENALYVASQSLLDQWGVYSFSPTATISNCLGVHIYLLVTGSSARIRNFQMFGAHTQAHKAQSYALMGLCIFMTR